MKYVGLSFGLPAFWSADMAETRKKQRAYRVLRCGLCGRNFKENAWWRHGVGRCVPWTYQASSEFNCTVADREGGDVDLRNTGI